MEFANRRLRICYLNISPHVVDIHLATLERNLRLLLEFDIAPVTSMTDKGFSPCDLLVVAAEKIPHDKFGDWLGGFADKMQAQGAIWVPALIVATIPFSIQRGLLEKAMKMNWYFDIIAPDQLDSLPIRVANLLRIHDHLHELHRYSAALDSLTKQTEALKQELLQLKK